MNESDHHIFLYEGMRLLDGDTMYRDFFQFTFPGSQAFYWLSFSIFGVKYWILPATIILLAALSVWSCLKVSGHVISGRLFLLPSVTLIFFGFRWLGLDGAHRMFSPVFVMLAISVLLRRDATGYILSGGFCAMASFFTQQRGMLVAFAIAVFLLFDGLKSNVPIDKTLRSLGLFVLSFLIFLTALCSYFTFEAGLENFLFATLVYPANYYRYALYNNFSVLPFELSGTLQISSLTKAIAAAPPLFYLFIVPLGYVVFWILYFIRRGQHDWEYWRDVVLVALVGTVLTFTNTAPNASRLFQVAMPGLIVLIWLLVYLKSHSRPLMARLVPAILVFTATTFILGSAYQAYRMQNDDYQLMDTPTGRLAFKPIPVIDNRYGWLLERTQPGDYVFEAYQPYIYFPLRLRNPTRYGQIWNTDYTRPEHVAESVRDLGANRPRYILWNNDNNKAIESRGPGDHTAPLSKYLLEHYIPAGEVIDIPEGHIQIWERK